MYYWSNYGLFISRATKLGFLPWDVKRQVQEMINPIILSFHIKYRLLLLATDELQN